MATSRRGIEPSLGRRIGRAVFGFLMALLLVAYLFEDLASSGISAYGSSWSDWPRWLVVASPAFIILVPAGLWLFAAWRRRSK